MRWFTVALCTLCRSQGFGSRGTSGGGLHGTRAGVVLCQTQFCNRSITGQSWTHQAQVWYCSENVAKKGQKALGREKWKEHRESKWLERKKEQRDEQRQLKGQGSRSAPQQSRHNTQRDHGLQRIHAGADTPLEGTRDKENPEPAPP